MRVWGYFLLRDLPISGWLVRMAIFLSIDATKLLISLAVHSFCSYAILDSKVNQALVVQFTLQAISYSAFGFLHEGSVLLFRIRRAPLPNTP